MSIAGMCRWYVNQLPVGQLFATRDLLSYGHRSAVDKATQSMVKSGMVLKKARAVFVRNDKNLKETTIEEIAETKARVFGKHIIPSGIAQAAKLGLERPIKLRKKGKKMVFPKPPFPGTTFAVLGTTSQFWTVHGDVQLKHISARKYFAAQQKVGEILAGIWQASVDATINFNAILMKADLNREQYRQFLQLATWVPEWVHAQYRNAQLGGQIHTPWKLYPVDNVSFPAVLLGRKVRAKVKETASVYLIDAGSGIGKSREPRCEDELDSPDALGLLSNCAAGEYKFKIRKRLFSSSSCSAPA